MPVELWHSDRRLYLNAKGKVVEADDDKRVELLVEQGGVLPLDDARKYGLVDKDGVTIVPTPKEK